MRYFFHIGYNGFNYHGWQRQAEHLSVQQVLEENLTKVLKEPVTILGCGRTDAQVHATQYFFHLDTEQKWDYDLVFRLNKMLPADIAVFDILPVKEDAHAQYDAVQRTYDYFIHTQKDPFLTQTSSYYPLKDPDAGKMKAAAQLLTKYNDYRAFCKSPGKYEHTVCKVSSARIFTEENGDKIRFQISSNRFLHGMIRAIVAKLLKVGTNEMTADAFEDLLIKKEAQAHLEFAYPHGLYLSKVVYPYLDMPARTEFSSLFQNRVENEWQEA